MNEQIRISPVRLIDENNGQVGVVTIQEAQHRATEAGMDLVEVAPGSKPPVCRIMDFGKWIYQQKRKAKESQKKQHVVSLKELRLRPKIDVHDRDIKVAHAAKFLEKGHKVQFTMQFRGREMMHVNLGYQIMEEILEILKDQAKIERPAEMLGKRLTMILMPAKAVPAEPKA